MKQDNDFNNAAKEAGKSITKALIGLVILAALFLGLCNRSEELTREQRIENQFSAVDGSHIEITSQIEKTVGSDIQVLKTSYMDRNTYIFVTEEFVSNGVKYKAFADVTIDGKVTNLSILDIY